MSTDISTKEANQASESINHPLLSEPQETKAPESPKIYKVMNKDSLIDVIMELTQQHLKSSTGETQEVESAMDHTEIPLSSVPPAPHLGGNPNSIDQIYEGHIFRLRHSELYFFLIFIEKNSSDESVWCSRRLDLLVHLCRLLS